MDADRKTRRTRPSKDAVATRLTKTDFGKIKNVAREVEMSSEMVDALSKERFGAPAINILSKRVPELVDLIRSVGEQNQRDARVKEAQAKQEAQEAEEAKRLRAEKLHQDTVDRAQQESERVRKIRREWSEKKSPRRKGRRRKAS